MIYLTGCDYRHAENIRLCTPAHMEMLLLDLQKKWINQHHINMTKADVFRLLYELERDQERTLPPELQACSRYIEAHFCDPALRMEDICRAGHVSASGLFRLFCAYYGTGPKQYLLSLRLSAACEMLLCGTRVQEAATACGFADAKYFSRIFKKYYGRPPGVYLPKDLKK